MYSYEKDCTYEFEATDAQILLTDEHGFPILGKHRYGKGEVFFSTLPIERMLLNTPDKINEPWYELYKQHLVKPGYIEKDNPYVGMTLHISGNDIYAVFVNYSNETMDAKVRYRSSLCDIQPIFGDTSCLRPFEASIIHGRIVSD